MRRAPQRGDVVWMSFDPQPGHEQAGRRPALVLSPGTFNELSGLCLVAPITSRVRRIPFEVRLPDGEGVTGVVRIDQMRSIDWNARRVEHAERVPEHIVAEALRKGRTLLS